MVNEASKIENATAAFTPLMGGVEQATKLVERLNKEAATTPFQFEDIADVAKALLPNMAGDINKTAETFRMLGDTAGGNSEKLKTITLGYNKALSKQKVDLESLNMIAEAGVPIFDQMSKSMGMSVPELYKMISAGKVTEKQLTATFQKMTSEGGIFFKGMEISSRTFSGQMSTLKDTIAITAAKIGNVFLKILTGDAGKVGILDKVNATLEKIGNWVAQNQAGIQKFIGAIGTIISGLIFMSPLILSIVAGFKLYSLVLTVLAIKQAILNILMTANPIGLIIIAVGVLIGVIAMLVIHWDIVKAAFISAWGVIKNILFSVADIIMSTYGNLFKFIIQGLSAIAGFLGFDTSGLDAFIGKIEQVQKTVKAGTGFNASVTTNNAAGMPGVQTTGSSIQKSISENNNNMMVTVGNKSENQVYGNGKQIKTGSTMALTPTG
jgi:tape measure domain-containing protein